MAKLIKTCEYCKGKYDPLLEICPKCGEVNKDEDLKEYKNIVPLHWLKQLFLAVGGSIGFQLVSLIIQIIIIFALGITKDTSQEEMLRATALINFISYGVLIGALMGTINVDVPKLFKSFAKWVPYVAGLIGLIAIFAFNFMYNLTLTIIGIKIGDNSNESGINSIIGMYPVLSILIFGLVGPICEELTYRVGLFSVLRRVNKWLPYLVVILVFALIHFDFSAIVEFNNPDYFTNLINEILNLPLYAFAGFTFSFLYDKFGLASSITAHTLNNLLSIGLAFIPHE